MVTVIRRNNFTCSCPECKADLAYQYTDIKEYKINGDYLGYYDLVQGIECPDCKTIIKADTYGNQKAQ